MARLANINPFKRSVETRDQNATDKTVERILAREANGSSIEIGMTSALESIASMYGRALLAAEPETMRNFNRNVLYEIGRSIVREGAFVGFVNGESIVECRIEQVTGSFNEDSWKFKLRYENPDGLTKSITMDREETIYIPYSYRLSQKHDPIPQWRLSDSSNQAFKRLIQAIVNESGTPSGQLFTIPSRDGSSATLDSLRSAIADLKGRVMVMESANTVATIQSRQSEYMIERIGANIPQSTIQAYKEFRNELYSVYGVPLALIEQSDGTGRREAWRQFLFGTIAPIGKLIENELRDKYDFGLKLNFEELRASDLTGRARAFQSLVGGGMSVEQAAGLSGLLLDND